MKYYFSVLLASFFYFIPSFSVDLASLCDHMEAELAFEENNYQILKNDARFKQQREAVLADDSSQEDATLGIYQGFSSSLLSIRTLIDLIQKYRQDGCYPNVLLRRIFEKRFLESNHIAKSYINSLQRNLETWFGPRSTSYCQNFSTSLRNGDVEALASLQSPEAQWNHIIGRTSLDRFQLLSLAIKQILLDMKEKGHQLTEENQTWLKASRTLHPFLKGEVEYLENPEQVAGINCGASNDKNFKNESELCSYYLWPNKVVKIKCQNLGIGNPKDTSSKVPCSFCACEFNHLPESILKDIVVAPQFKDKTDPPLPPFNFPADLDVMAKKSNSPTKVKDVDITVTVPNALEEPKPSNEFTYLENHAPPTPVETKNAGVDIWSEDEEKEVIILDPRVEHDLHQLRKRKEAAQTATVSTTVTLATPELTPQQIMVKNLGLAEKEWLRKLLSNELKIASYRNFKQAWHQLCGHNSIVASKKGSSHFKLLDQNGAVVGGIFHHGEGQEYWAKAISDLRDNFLAIGITADLLGSM